MFSAGVLCSGVCPCPLILLMTLVLGPRSSLLPPAGVSTWLVSRAGEDKGQEKTKNTEDVIKLWQITCLWSWALVPLLLDASRIFPDPWSGMRVGPGSTLVDGTTHFFLIILKKTILVIFVPKVSGPHWLSIFFRKNVLQWLVLSLGCVLSSPTFRVVFHRYSVTRISVAAII